MHAGHSRTRKSVGLSAAYAKPSNANALVFCNFVIPRSDQAALDEIQGPMNSHLPPAFLEACRTVQYTRTRLLLHILVLSNIYATYDQSPLIGKQRKRLSRFKRHFHMEPAAAS